MFPEMPDHVEEKGFKFFFPGNHPSPARNWHCQALLRELPNTWVHFLGVNTAEMLQRLWKYQGIISFLAQDPPTTLKCPLCVWQVLEELFPSCAPSLLLPPAKTCVFCLPRYRCRNSNMILV